MTTEKSRLERRSLITPQVGVLFSRVTYRVRRHVAGIKAFSVVKPARLSGQVRTRTKT